MDARAAQWASPYGLIGMLTAGQAIAEAKGERPLFTVPVSDDVKRYWARVGFFRHAAELFELHGRVPKAAATGPSDVLLDVTPVRAMEDVHQVVEKISETASRILHGELGLERDATAIQYGAFRIVPEYCGARRHQWLGGGAGVYFPAPVGPAGRGDRRQRCGHRVPPLAGEHPRQALRRALGRRCGAGGRADPGREPVPRSRPRSGPRRDQGVPGPLEGQDLDPERYGAAVDRPGLGRRPSPGRPPPVLSRSPGADHHSRPRRPRADDRDHPDRSPAAGDGGVALPQPRHPAHRRGGPEPHRGRALPLRLSHRPAGLLRHRAARLQLRRGDRRQAAAGAGLQPAPGSSCSAVSATTSTTRSSRC